MGGRHGGRGRGPKTKRARGRNGSQYSLDGELRILQGNTKRSTERLNKMLKSEYASENGPSAHVLALTDPALAMAWSSKYSYVMDMCPSRPLLESDDPKEKRRQQQIAKKEADKQAKRRATRKAKGLPTPDEQGEQEPRDDPITLSRVFFLVHKSIPRKSWSVEYHDDANKNMAATLYLKTKVGEIAIHNVQNPNTTDEKIKVDLLTKRTSSGLHMVLGDFNLHHSDWGGNLFNPGREGISSRQLSDKMKKAEMKLITKPGTVTYTRGAANKDGSTKPSCIDLTFVSKDLQPRVVSWGVDGVSYWEESDHRPIRTVLDIQPLQDETRRYQFKKAELGRYLKDIEESMVALNEARLETSEELDEAADTFSSIMIKSMDRCIPTRLTNPPPRCTGRTDATGERLGLTIEGTSPSSSPRPAPEPTTGAGRPQQPGHGTLRIKTSSGYKVRAADGYRSHVAKKSKSPNGVWTTSRMGQRISAPKLASDVPPLSEDTGGITYTTEEEKQTCLRNSLWSRTSHGEAHGELRFPYLAPDRPLYTMDQSLDEKTIDRLIRRLPSGKASGRDGIPNEAIKKARAVLVPFLTRFFGACLALSHFPLPFRYAITAVLPKPDKGAYNSPKSWRPIALLSCVGKMLERIAADRLKLFATEHALLPNSQYGGPGKSTANAMQDMLGVVYKAWSGKRKRKAKRYFLRRMRKVTMMGLDMSGAYDSIEREKLLQVLADTGAPEWFIRFIWSFLSQRGTSLKLPRSMSDPFVVEIGIPQGSPLSPLLFLLFTTPLLTLINEHQHPIEGVTVYAFAYVDDTYLVAVSDSYHQNCRGLEVVHERIMEWATAADIRFSPSKYNIMHFKCPSDTGPDCELLPDIKGLKDNPHCLRQKLKVLGVILDPGLTWEHHITHIETKVEKSLKHLRNVLGSTWGMPIQTARQIYLAKIRTTISYACSTWFVHSPNRRLDWSLKHSQIQRLEKLQYKCLKQISGALGKTSQRVLEKELEIESIRVFLYRTMISSRAKFLNIKDDHDYIQDVFVPTRILGMRPTAYQRLDLDARHLCVDVVRHVLAQKKGNVEKLLKVWKNPARRKTVINQHAKQLAQKQSAEIWDDYRRKRAAKYCQRHHPLALEESWGPQSLRLYRGMTRGQSTMLLQCRTEFIGLSGFLNGIQAKRPSDDAQDPDSVESPPLIPAECPCGQSKQTVFHMFMRCPALGLARRRLEAKVGHLDFQQLLTVHGTVAADWAITYFNLDQFAFPRAFSQFADVKEDIDNDEEYRG
ncbi:hypothetical protein F66182_3374 [Fusarium sp. NRRL 66182]|nr:hypothetical protein F66182_3374 [Fusarium sp. NRRL 66182]